MIVNHNGTFIPAEQARWSLTDGAALFGDSLFETIKARGQTLLHLEDHLDRLERACRSLEMPCHRARIAAALRQTAVRLPTAVSRLRLTLSRGPFAALAFPSAEQGHFFITAAPYQEPTAAERRQGIACVFAPNRRVNPLCHLPQMKRGNYADCLYAADHARRLDAREALFVDERGMVLEGTTSNLFIVRDNTLITPPAGELVLDGIMRHQLLKRARARGLPTVERTIHRDDLFAAEEAFISNVLIEVLPIDRIENRFISRGFIGESLMTTGKSASDEKNLS